MAKLAGAFVTLLIVGVLTTQSGRSGSTPSAPCPAAPASSHR